MASTEKTLSDLGLKWVIYYAYHIHGYLSLIICIIGTIGNILNVIVFTRKRMISPIKTILASLAIVDLVVLFTYYYKAWYFYLKPDANPYIYWFNSYQIARIMLWMHHTTHIFVNTSVWLTVLASIWKYKAITNPFRNRIWCDTKITCKSISLIFILCVLFHLPNIIVKRINPVTISQWNMTYYTLTFDESNHSSVILHRVDYFIHSFVFTLTPAILIAIYTAKLIFTFSKMKENQRKLIADANTNPTLLNTKKQIARTTLTLIILSVLCFITQLPQSISTLSSPYIGGKNFFIYENATKEFISILEVINAAFTFFLYYSNSIQFRRNLNALIGIKTSTSNEWRSALSSLTHVV